MSIAIRKAAAQTSTGYPQVRMRRMRATAGLRAMVREAHIHLEKLIYPLFIVEGTNVHDPISAMPGIYQQSIDQALKEVEQCVEGGITSLLLFGIPDAKDSQATGAW